MVEEKLYINLYNPETKKRFLERYDNTDTQTTYSYIFSRIKEAEVKVDKDIYEFNLPQLERALYLIRPVSNSAAKSAGRIITSYITWSISQGLRENNLNPLTMVEGKWFEKFVVSMKMYFSDLELKNIEKDIVNAQDAVIPRLLFEGINGHGGSEILNLKKNDCDFENNILTVNDDRKGQRKIEVSRDLMGLIRAAIREATYQKENGKSDARNPELSLVKNDYVVRSVATRVENYDRADKHTIYRRLSMLASEKVFNIPNFTSKNIVRSGMIKMASDIYNRDGNNGEELTTDQLKEIGKRFNLSLVAGEYYNYSAMRDYINLENIKKFYDI